jgi:hypothetical protein
MWRNRVFIAAVFVVAAGRSRPLAADSSELAKQLTAMVVAQHRDAVAAPDPDAADRFVAALVFPNAQLLVISATYAAPVLLMQQIAAKDYKDVYLALQQSGRKDGSLFFQDMGADGLHPESATVDVLYENNGDPFLFDRAHRPRGLSDAAYQQKLTSADAQYSRLLTLLLGQLKQSGAAANPKQ